MQATPVTDDVGLRAKDFFDTVDRVKQEQSVLAVRLVNRAIGSKIAQQYHRASRRILLLDYDGTLVPFAKYPEMAVPGERVLRQLKRLTDDPKNTVVIISGREQKFLDKWFSSLRAVLVAEHGGFVRMLPSGWASLVDVNSAWKQQVLPVLQRYADRCTGAFIEEKSLSLVWHYRGADPGISLLRSQELKEELRELASRDGKLQILEGHKIIEIKKSGYDKGSVVQRLLGRTRYDFMLAIGDDKTDEDLFRILPAAALTIKIGISSSLAKYNLANQQGVVRLIGHLLSGTE